MRKDRIWFKNELEMFSSLSNDCIPIVQTGSVKIKRDDKSLALPTLLSFDRFSHFLIPSRLSDLEPLIVLLTQRTICDPSNLVDAIRQLAKIEDFKDDYSYDWHRHVYFLIYRSNHQTFYGYKNSRWSKDDAQQFLCDKGYITIPRYSIQ